MILMAKDHWQRAARTTVAAVAGLPPERWQGSGDCNRYPGMLHSLALKGNTLEV
jgi:hypothetical protein